jgi:integrase
MKGYVRKRGDKWSFTVDIGKDPRTGKRKQKTQSGFKTKKEAQAALAELVSNVEKGSYIEPSKRKFRDFALEYLEKVYKNKVKASTYDRTRSLLLNQIIPWFGNADLKDIDQFLVYEFYEEKKNEGLAPSYIQRMHEITKKWLAIAYQWELIPKNIASLIEPPRNTKKVMNVWNIGQVNEFLKHTKHSRYHPIFFVAAYTGMRKGEIIGLRWEDIDLEAKTLQVRRTLYRITGETLLTEPKTPNAYRTIHLDDDLVRVFRKQKVKQNLEKLKYGPAYIESNMVFTQETGDYISPSAVNGLFRRFLQQLGLPEIRFHDLRHTHATILLGMGVNPKLVSERLGHSSVAITLDVYSHVLPSMKQDLSDQFSKVMKSGTNVVK